jgi:hypothetical protein
MDIVVSVNWGGGKSTASVVSVQFVDEILALFNACEGMAQSAFILLPIHGMKILRHIDAILRYFGIKKLGTGRDMAHGVTAMLPNMYLIKPSVIRLPRSKRIIHG